jgi:large subunit ribosomal protein L9
VLELPGQIKTTGTHRVAARLHPDVRAEISLEVTAVS